MTLLTSNFSSSGKQILHSLIGRASALENASLRANREIVKGTLTTAKMIAPARIVKVNITDGTLAVDLEDGRNIAVPFGWYPRVAHGTDKERANFQITGAGYGIHWPDLDEDIGVEGLLLGKKSAESPASFARWLDQRKPRQEEFPLLS